MNIALIRLSSLGDIILAMASLQIIRKHIPDCRITWVTDSRFSEILQHNPDIAECVSIDLKGIKKSRSFFRLTKAFRLLSSLEKFDAVIDMHGMIKSAITGAILKGGVYGFDRSLIKEPLSSIFYQRSCHIPLEQPAATRFAKLAGACLGFDISDADMQNLSPFLFCDEKDRAAVREHFISSRPNILMVPETSAPYKNYPPERFAKLAAMLDANILLCHGNARELAAANRIAQLSKNTRVLPSITLNQLKGAVAMCDLVIGGDSGPTHIAWGCGVPSITLYGATPICTPPSEINLTIKSDTRINYRSINSRDYSVCEISEDEIVHLANTLLENRPSSRKSQI